MFFILKKQAYQTCQRLANQKLLRSVIILNRESNEAKQRILYYFLTFKRPACTLCIYSDVLLAVKSSTNCLKVIYNKEVAWSEKKTS